MLLQLLLGAGSLGLLCMLWGLWQRYADGVDPKAASDTRAGGRCCVPHRPSSDHPHP